MNELRTLIISRRGESETFIASQIHSGKSCFGGSSAQVSAEMGGRANVEVSDILGMRQHYLDLKEE